MSSSRSSPDASHRGMRGYACVPCAKRKVRCDRLQPCTNCQKRPGDECVYLAPLPRRRGPKVSADAATLERLNKLENMVRVMGGDPDKHIPPSSSSFSSTSPISSAKSLPPYHPPPPPAATSRTVYMPGARQDNDDSAVAQDDFFVPVARESVAILPIASKSGRLLGDSQSRTRYLDDTIWSSLNDEAKEDDNNNNDHNGLLCEDEINPSIKVNRVNPMQQPQIDGPGSLFLGGPRPRAYLASHHPDAAQIHGLWRNFLSNVHPLLHIFTAWQKEKVVSYVLRDRRQLSKPTELFLFSMYLFAVLSMDDEECKLLLAESRLVLLDRYQDATEQALLNAGFLRTTDIVVLQSFVMYLLCIRQRSDSSTLWMLSGVAIRLGQRIGLHKDGSTLGLSAYETELRRRLWWQIVFLDGRAAELSGTRLTALIEHDVKLPCNASDDELQPSLKELPEGRLGATSNLHCLVRFEILNFFASLKRSDGSSAGFSYFGDRNIPLAEKDATINGLEKLLQHKYLQFCDLLDPIHFLTNIVIRAAVNGIRLMAHHPQNRGESLKDLEPAEREHIVTMSKRSMELDVLCHSNKNLRPLLWHIDNYFAWNGLILLFVELRRDPDRHDVRKLWSLLEEVYAAHPHFITDRRKSLHVAVGKLATKAWQAQAASVTGQHLTMPVPEFVRSLQSIQDAEDDARRRRPDPIPQVTAIREHERQKLLNTVAGGTVAEDSMYPGGHDDPMDMSGADAYQNGLGGPSADNNANMSMEPSPGASLGSLDFSPMDWGQWDALIFEQLQMDDFSSAQAGASAPMMFGDFQTEAASLGLNM